MLIKNANIYLGQKNFMKGSLLVKEGKIAAILAADFACENLGAKTVIDAKGALLSPAFIDLHVHFREPGFSYKATIASESRAAAKGGFSTVATMPNLNPVPDSLVNLQAQLEIIKKDSVIRVIPYASVTKGEKGEELSDFLALAPFCVGFSDDGRGVESSSLMLEAMKMAAKVNKPIASHCEDLGLFTGCMHEGSQAEKMKLPGIPSACESAQVARDMLLAQLACAHFHVCHISAKESLELVRLGKKMGIRVSAEVTPHHLLSTHEDVKDSIWKMNPPLREEADRKVLLEALKEGVLDVIATDHAPHSAEDKAKGMEKSAFGIISIEHAFSLMYSQLVLHEGLELATLLDAMSANPAKLFKLTGGKIELGAAADLVLIDLNREFVLSEEDIISKAKNCPYIGRKLSSRVLLTVVDGKIVYKDEAC